MKTPTYLLKRALPIGLALYFTGIGHAALTEGLVAYYDLDNLDGGRATDRVRGLNMEAINLSDADLIEGVSGKAIHFDATKQTMLERIHADGDALPLHQYDTITISFWTRANAQEQFDENGNGTNDRRFFSEGNTGNNNPLFNIGTANDGSNDGIDLFIRATGTDTLNHTKSVSEPLDGEDWHHIVWTQNSAESVLYIDGVADSADFNANAFAPMERFTADNNTLLNTTSIGGIRRGAPSHWVTGDIDEVGLWNRTLSADEVVELFNAKTPFGSDNPLLDGLVSRWKMDEIQGGKVVDAVSGMNLDAINLSEADIIPGRWGNAIRFDATKQTMLERIHAEGDPLPIHQNDTLTVSFWTRANAQEQFDENGNGTNDRRFFSEGNTGNNNPLFNIGTANDGSNNGIDLFIRATGTDTLNHTKSVIEPLDGGEEWHHIVWTQVGADSKLYIDGVLDSADFNANAFAPTERFTPDNNTTLNTTSIGGIRRGAPSHWITGDIDEVALWDRALSADEVVLLYEDGIDPPLLIDLVSYWPLDAINGGKAEDVISGLSMDAINLSDADLVDGVKGKAISFDATKQTMLERIHAEGDALPIHQYDNITVSFWTKANAQEQFDENGNGTNDRRFFSEGNTGNNNPLFNIGTANDGSNNGIDLFIRATGTDTLNHTKSVQEPLDGEDWHHIVWTQNGAESVLYVDGVADSADFNANAFAPTERFTADNNTLVNTTSIGGIRRGAPSHWITGLIDEVAVWKRTLTADEVVDLFENGIPVGGDGPLIPLFIDVAAERLTVPKGNPAILTWESNADATFSVEGIGEVEAAFGVGRLEVPITEQATYTVTATRGDESVSGDVTVNVREGVVPGWFLLDDFNNWDTGLLRDSTKIGRKEYWTNPSPDPAGFITDLEGERVLTMNQEGEETMFTLLQSVETKDNEARTAFFRVRLNGSDETAAHLRAGLTNKSMRGDGFGGDTNGDLGGFVIITRLDGDDFGTIAIGPDGQPADFEMALDTWYKVWLDITNSPGDSDDTIAVHIAEENGTRVTIFEESMGDRGNVINHDRFFLAAKGENIGVEAFYVDDVFVSEGGLGDTDPLDTDDPNLAVRTRGIFNDVDSSGGPFERELPILNIGQTNSLTITGAQLTGADADLFTVSDPSGTLGPGEQTSINITFTPSGRTGGVLAFLGLTSNDQSNPVVTVDLSAIVPSTNQLIGHYRMDETDGEIMLDSALLRHGTYVAVDGGAFELGTGNLADGTAVNVSRSGATGGGYAQARLSGGNLTSFSVSMWIQPDDGEQSSLFAKGEQGGTPAFALLYNGGSVFWFNEENEVTDPVGSIAAGTKANIVLAYTDRNGGDAGADNLRIYIDGAEVLNQDAPPAIVDVAANPLLIGSYFGTLSFDGIIDDVQVYAKAVTGEDAAFLFANPGQPLGENINLDSDDDGITDADERAIGSNPSNPDTDGDGILDGAERDAGTSPILADTDNDGVSDNAEAAAGTDPTNADSDGDGASDGEELAFGSDPNSAASTPTGAAFTGFEHAAPGATSFVYDGVELGWDGPSNGDVGVVSNLVVGEDEFNLGGRQLMVHNGNIELTTDAIAIDSAGDAVVSVDVRVFQNSTGIENNDFIDLCVLTSTDGVNFDNEICFLSVEGTREGPSEENPRDVLEEVFEVDPAEAPADGDFVTISTSAGDLPAGTTHIKVKVAASNNSDSEYFFFDNIVVSGSNGEVVADVPQPTAGFNVTSITYDAANGGTVTITFESEDGKAYEIQRSPSLTDFARLQDVTGTGASTTVEGVLSGGLDAAYFRVIEK